MKILTWNINGIRASRILLKDLFDSLDADIICLQETKVTRDQLDSSVATVAGYNSYFSFSKKRSGYSGVATFCKDSVTPWCAEEGLSGLITANQDEGISCYGNHSHFTDDELESLDAEGRTVITQHKIKNEAGKEEDLVIINVYCPRADAEKEDRKLYKLRFYALLQTRAEALLQEGRHVIILGDINSCHKQIDKCNPVDEEGERARPGRLWMNQLIWETGRDSAISMSEDEKASMPGTTPSVQGGMFIDTFRQFHPDQKDAFTNWCTLTGARQTNYGRRLDYIFADVPLTQKYFADVIIMPEVEGSDHCPVRALVNAVVIPCKKCPPLCTKFMPEFSGRQQRLSDIFAKVSSKKTAPTLKPSKSEPLITSPGKVVNSTKPVLASKGDSRSESIKRSLVKTNDKPALNKRFKSTQPPAKQANLMKFFGKPKLNAKNSEDLNQKSETFDSTLKESIPSQDSNQSSQESLECTEDVETLSSGGSLSGSQESGNTRVSPINSSGKETPNSQMSEMGDNFHAANSSIDLKSTTKSKSSAALAWKTLLSGPGKAPLCKGHKEPCVLRTVKKDGANKGKQFYVCARGEGHSSNPEARCDFFKWVERKKLT